MQIKRGNTVIADVHLMDSSYITEEIMGEHSLILNFRTLEPIELEIHDYVLFQGIEYRIRHHERIQKVMKDLGWEYSVKFYAEQYDLQDVLFFLNGKPERRKNADNFNGTARQMLDLIVENMNRVFSGWKAGDCLETHTETFNFKDKKCSAVLDDVAKTFETEYWIAGKTINLGKREYDNYGLYLGQGEGMGFRDLDLTAVDEKPPVTVLYPYGSDKNLTTEYGSDYLLMPDGKLSLEKNIDTYGRFEEAVSFDHIFPAKEFTVTAKIDHRTLQSTDFDFNLMECLIEGTNPIVTFQNGGLAGYDLEIVEDSWDNNLKQFKLKQNEEENALTVPSEQITFNVGDRFILTGIKMPQKYIEEAEVKLEEEAQKYLDEHCEKRVQLSGKCDDILFRKKKYYIRCGQMIHIISEKLNIDREIRVTKVKRYLENNDEQPYRYELTLSDFLQSNGFKDLVDDIKKMPEEIVNKSKESLTYSRRRWQDAKETQSMLENLLKDAVDGFTEGISPIWVQTMSMLVGDQSLQFRFVNNLSQLQTDNPITGFNHDQQVFTCKNGYLQHMTLDITNLSISHSEEEYKYWELTERNLDVTKAVPYYLYAVCNKNMGTENNKKVGKGTYHLSPDTIKMDNGENYYFLIGILSSPFNGKERSFVPVYGYTEILPGQINVERIVSPDGFQKWDMRDQSFRIGDENNYFAYNTDGTRRLLLKGVLAQSNSGDPNDVSEIGVFKGVWVYGKTYYAGDEVTYNGSTYRCLAEKTVSYPTSTIDWIVIAKKGDTGAQGNTGAQGAQGPQGNPGKDGVDGIQGMIVRTTEWTAGKTYRNDKNIKVDTNIRYLDIVTVWENNKQNIFQCRTTHNSAASNKPVVGSTTTYWEPFNQMGPIYTPLLLADNAKIDFMQGNQLVIHKAQDNSITAGLSGAGTGVNGVRIWAGGSNPTTANFKVDENGKMTAKEAEIEGTIESTKGNIGGFKINSTFLKHDRTDNEGNVKIDLGRFIPAVGGLAGPAVRISNSFKSNHYNEKSVGLEIQATGARDSPYPQFNGEYRYQNIGIWNNSGYIGVGNYLTSEFALSTNLYSPANIFKDALTRNIVCYTKEQLVFLPTVKQIEDVFGYYTNTDATQSHGVVMLRFFTGWEGYTFVASPESSVHIYYNGSTVKDSTNLTSFDNLKINPYRVVEFYFRERNWFVNGNSK